MTKPVDENAQTLGVSTCANCPHIHLNVQQDGIRISMSLDDEDWKFLWDAYRQKVMERDGKIPDGLHVH